jgi:hypothetical protein
VPFCIKQRAYYFSLVCGALCELFTSVLALECCRSLGVTRVDAAFLFWLLLPSTVKLLHLTSLLSSMMCLSRGFLYRGDRLEAKGDRLCNFNRLFFPYYNMQHTRSKQNGLCFMQTDTQPSQTSSEWHITPNPPVMTKSRAPAGENNYPENGLVKPPRRDTRALSPAGMFGGKAPLRLAAQKSRL